MTIGERLAKIRKDKGYKQKEIAELLNVSQQIISNIERNITTPDIEILKRTADVYAISLDELIGRRFENYNDNDVTQQIINIVEKMDDTGKELSLDLVNQVAKHQGNNNAK
jgi:transcriptional regulator with XRE-family HTH domain